MDVSSEAFCSGTAAEVVPGRQIDADVVTMNSRVTLADLADEFLLAKNAPSSETEQAADTNNPLLRVPSGPKGTPFADRSPGSEARTVLAIPCERLA